MKGTLNIGIAPPEILGECIVTVNVGQTVRITKSMLMNSLPPYVQVNDIPMGGIKIVGHNNTPTTLLAQSNQPDTIAYFRRLTTRIYKNSSGVIINGEITNAQMDNTTGFRVTGVSVGSSYITYLAKAVLGSEESEYSSVTGRIRINVVPATCGTTTASDFEVNIPLYTATVITEDMILNGYNNTANQPASEVRIDEVPSLGLLLVNGVPAQVNDIITIEQIGLGGMVYIPDPTVQGVGDTAIVRYSIKDVCNTNFYTNGS